MGEWLRSSYCAAGECIEVEGGSARVCVRSSRKPERCIDFTRAEWAAFVAGVKNGDFDDV